MMHGQRVVVECRLHNYNSSKRQTWLQGSLWRHSGPHMQWDLPSYLWSLQYSACCTQACCCSTAMKLHGHHACITHWLLSPSPPPTPPSPHSLRCGLLSNSTETGGVGCCLIQLLGSETLLGIGRRLQRSNELRGEWLKREGVAVFVCVLFSSLSQWLTKPIEPTPALTTAWESKVLRKHSCLWCGHKGKETSDGHTLTYT